MWTLHLPQCAHFAQRLVALDSLSQHAVSCRHGGVTVIRHNQLRDIIADLCRKAHLSVSVEAGHCMCRDNNHSRLADVLVEGWEEANLLP